MTIDGSWLSSFKEEAPEAFTKNIPFHPQAVFSDGQIRLMQSPPNSPQTWDDYIFKRFISYYTNLLKHSKTLIVAFDNYQYVPTAKAMTQTSRRKHIPTIPFSETSPLPCMVPEGESWTQHIANRTFKVKVIELITMRLPKLLLSKFPDATIIIDYDQPILYTKDSFQDLDMPPLGEADVKFTRWAEMYPKLLVDSIDGDSVPISLIHLERKLQQQSTTPPHVVILRYKINLEKKRKSPDAPKPHKEFEYLNVPLLYLTLKQAVSQATGKLLFHQHIGHEMRMITTLIILTGTDFSRHLPQVSGKTVWDMLVSLWVPLIISYDPLSSQITPEKALSKLIPTIYQTKFSKQLPRKPENYDDLYHLLSHSKLAPRTKSSLASEPQILCTVLNANWILQYWSGESPPDPISPQFGYQKYKGKVYYQDQTPVYQADKA